MAEEIARSEVEVWRLAHKVGAEYIGMLNDPVVPQTYRDGAVGYRGYVEQVLVGAGYPIVADETATRPRSSGGVQSCNWCPQPSSPDPRAHPDGQRSHLDAGETNSAGGEDRG